MLMKDKAQTWLEDAGTMSCPQHHWISYSGQDWAPQWAISFVPWNLHSPTLLLLWMYTVNPPQSQKTMLLQLLFIVIKTSHQMFQKLFRKQMFQILEVLLTLGGIPSHPLREKRSIWPIQKVLKKNCLRNNVAQRLQSLFECMLELLSYNYLGKKLVSQILVIVLFKFV